MSQRQTNTISPWFGSDRMIAKTIGEQSAGYEWAGVPFMGGASALQYIQCRAGVANDKHRHIINLAKVIRDPKLKERLVEKLDAALFHPDELAEAQKYCRAIEAEIESSVSLFREGATTFNLSAPLVEWAYHYFLTAWLPRSGSAGTDGEFGGKLSTRYNANGGGSNVRFRSAAAAIDGLWHPVFRKWEFECIDAFEFLNNVKDAPGKFLYVDAPWPDVGDGYRHKFTRRDQEKLAMVLGEYREVKVCIRFGDHQLIRELYPAARWKWILQDSRDQANGEVKEVLIVGGGGA